MIFSNFKADFLNNVFLQISSLVESSFVEIRVFLPATLQKELLQVRFLGISRINTLPSQHYNVGSTLLQCCGSDVEDKAKLDVVFSTLYSIYTTLVSDVETTLTQTYLSVVSKWPQH